MGTRVVVCTHLSGKDPHRQVAVGKVVRSGSLGGVMISALAWNAREVGSIPALSTIFPIFIIPHDNILVLVQPFQCGSITHSKRTASCTTNYYHVWLSCVQYKTLLLYICRTGLGFSNNHIMRGHRNFVVSVCTMPPDERYPHGLIMTGSNDNIIHAYSLENAEPQYTLQGHTNTGTLFMYT